MFDCREGDSCAWCPHVRIERCRDLEGVGKGHELSGSREPTLKRSALNDRRRAPAGLSRLQSNCPERPGAVSPCQTPAMTHQHTPLRSLPREEILPAWRAAVLAYLQKLRISPRNLVVGPSLRLGANLPLVSSCRFVAEVGNGRAKASEALSRPSQSHRAPGKSRSRGAPTLSFAVQLRSLVRPLTHFRASGMVYTSDAKEP